MSSHFAITTAQLENEVPAGSAVEFMFVVTNQTGGPVEVQARVAPLGGADASWFTPAVSEAYSFTVDGTQTFQVKAAAPAGTAPTEARFRLDVFDTKRPEAVYTEGQEAIVRVTKAAVKPVEQFPWWWVAAAVALLLGIGIAVWQWPDPDPVVLPDLTGMTYPAAVNALQELGLEFTSEPVRVTDAAKAFIVISQDPDPGPLADLEQEIVVRYGKQGTIGPGRPRLDAVLMEAVEARPDWTEAVKAIKRERVR